jgi:hypothetical protein
MILLASLMLLVTGVTVVACVMLLLASFKFLMVSSCWHPLILNTIGQAQKGTIFLRTYLSEKAVIIDVDRRLQAIRHWVSRQAD